MLIMSKLNGNGTTHQLSKIDAIKEIIFGQTMQEYDERFSKLEALLISNQKKLEASSKQKITSLQKEIESLKAESEAKRSSLEAKLEKQIKLLEEKKVEVSRLKKHLIQLIENI